MRSPSFTTSCVDARLLQSRRQVGAVALGERGCGVDPGTSGGPEAGGVEDLVASGHLRPDFAGDLGLRQGGEIDRLVRLTQDLSAVRGAELGQGPGRCLRIGDVGLLEAGRIDRERRRHGGVVRQRCRERLRARGRGVREDETDFERTTPSDGARRTSLLIREERREARDRRCRVLPVERDRDGVHVTARPAQRRAAHVDGQGPRRTRAGTARRRCVAFVTQHGHARRRRRPLAGAPTRHGDVGLATQHVAARRAVGCLLELRRAVET